VSGNTEFRSNPENFCYRHPERQSFVLCQRCLRTICPECQTQMPVGVICPECLAEQQKGAPASVKRMPRARRNTVRTHSSRPIMTYSIMGLTGFVFLLQLIPGFGAIVQNELSMFAPYLYPGLSGHFEPWRLFTVLLVHSGFAHVGLNMLALWMIGRNLEPLLGRTRFLVLYLLSGLGGSVFIVLFGFGTPVIGASGAIFGLFGALLVIGRHIGANITGIAIVLGINLVITLTPLIGGLFGGGAGAVQVSWQAHIGGLVVGSLVGLIFARTRATRQQRTQMWLLIGLTAVMVLLLLVPLAVYG